MNAPLTIRILDFRFGAWPEVAPLNPALIPGSALLKLTLDLDWTDPDAAAVLGRVEDALARVSPTFRRHQCRGPHVYRVFSRVRGEGPPHDGGKPPEPSLALAHILEHAILDTVAFVTGAERVSGVTGAHRDAEHVYDVFVECSDTATASLAVQTALMWVADILEGREPEPRSRLALELARYLWRRRTMVALESVASELGLGACEVAAAAEALGERGFAVEIRPTMDLSGGRWIEAPGLPPSA